MGERTELYHTIKIPLSLPAQRSAYLGHGRQPVDSNVVAPLFFPKAPQGPSE